MLARIGVRFELWLGLVLSLPYTKPSYYAVTCTCRLQPNSQASLVPKFSPGVIPPDSRSKGEGTEGWEEGKRKGERGRDGGCVMAVGGGVDAHTVIECREFFQRNLIDSVTALAALTKPWRRLVRFGASQFSGRNLFVIFFSWWKNAAQCVVRIDTLFPASGVDGGPFNVVGFVWAACGSQERPKAPPATQDA